MSSSCSAFLSSSSESLTSLSTSLSVTPPVCFNLQGRLPLGLSRSRHWNGRGSGRGEGGEEGGGGGEEGRKLQTLWLSLSLWCLSWRLEELTEDVKEAKVAGLGLLGSGSHSCRRTQAGEGGGATWKTLGNRKNKNEGESGDMFLLHEFISLHLSQDKILFWVERWHYCCEQEQHHHCRRVYD